MTALRICLLASCIALCATGCKRKAPAPVPPPPPPSADNVETKPEPPEITSFQAEPASITAGDTATLSWTVVRASSVVVEPGIGSVQERGSRSVTPSNTTTYRLIAKGEGGEVTATATVTVSARPAEPPPAAPSPTLSLFERLNRDVSDIFFDFDKYSLRDDARGVLQSNADALKRILNDFPSERIQIEGHADERGSAEYNLALGDQRARIALDFLTQFGLPQNRFQVLSLGKERPQCTEEAESCHQKNRRAHFSPAQ